MFLVAIVKILVVILFYVGVFEFMEKPLPLQNTLLSSFVIRTPRRGLRSSNRHKQNFTSQGLLSNYNIFANLGFIQRICPQIQQVLVITNFKANFDWKEFDFGIM